MWTFRQLTNAQFITTHLLLCESSQYRPTYKLVQWFPKFYQKTAFFVMTHCGNMIKNIQSHCFLCFTWDHKTFTPFFHKPGLLKQSKDKMPKVASVTKLPFRSFISWACTVSTYNVALIANRLRVNIGLGLERGPIYLGWGEIMHFLMVSLPNTSVRESLQQSTAEPTQWPHSRPISLQPIGNMSERQPYLPLPTSFQLQ